MGKINRFAAKSKLMEISITYGNEVFSFNLNEELQISEERLQREITEQPSSFAFLSMLHKKLLKSAKDLEMKMKAVRAQQYLNWKQDINPDTGRPYSDDQADAYAEVSKKYREALSIYLNALDQVNTIETAVKSFEMRSNLIQTLSANSRSKNN